MIEGTARVTWLRFSIFFSFVFLISCQSASKKAEIELEKTLIRFSALESRIEKTCLVETTLSGPMRARYQESYPDQSESISLSKNYLWEVSHRRCEFQSNSKDLPAWEENHLKILKGAFCTLLMGFQIQSPWEGVDWIQADRTYREGAWTWKKPSPGIEELRWTFRPLKLRVTSEQGSEFTAEYLETSSFPRLLRMERRSSQSGLRLFPIEFQDFSNGDVSSVFPRELEKVDLSIQDASLTEFQYYGQARILRCE